MRLPSATDHPTAQSAVQQTATIDLRAVPQTETDLSRREPSDPHDGGDDSYVELNVLLTDEAFRCLHTASEESGDSRTDVVNRALVVYAAIQTAAAHGGGSVTFRSRHGRRHRAIIV